MRSRQLAKVDMYFTVFLFKKKSTVRTEDEAARNKVRMNFKVFYLSLKFLLFFPTYYYFNASIKKL